jgi:hypothetical protein
MPRGVYDRSHMKSKRAVEKTVPKTEKAVGSSPVSAPIKAKRPYHRRTQVEAVTGSTGVGNVGVLSTAPINELYQHLGHITETRQQIAGSAAGHNEVLLHHIDAELSDTITSLKSWRENRFPMKEAVAVKKEESEEIIHKTAAPAAPAPAINAPIPAPVLPAPVQVPGVAAPPLPFTPAAVADVREALQHN